jgi:hypothetical protein
MPYGELIRTKTFFDSSNDKEIRDLKAKGEDGAMPL